MAQDDVIVKAKQCNCKKTKCLKLYCDCFASGELCGNKYQYIKYIYIYILKYIYLYIRCKL